MRWVQRVLQPCVTGVAWGNPVRVSGGRPQDGRDDLFQRVYFCWGSAAAAAVVWGKAGGRARSRLRGDGEDFGDVFLAQV